MTIPCLLRWVLGIGDCFRCEVCGGCAHTHPEAVHFYRERP